MISASYVNWQPLHLAKFTDLHGYERCLLLASVIPT